MPSTNLLTKESYCKDISSNKNNNQFITSQLKFIQDKNLQTQKLDALNNILFDETKSINLESSNKDSNNFEFYNNKYNFYLLF